MKSGVKNELNLEGVRESTASKEDNYIHKKKKTLLNNDNVAIVTLNINKTLKSQRT